MHSSPNPLFQGRALPAWLWLPLWIAGLLLHADPFLSRIPDLMLPEGGGPRELPIRLVPAQSVSLSAEADDLLLFPAGSLVIQGESSAPVLRLQPAPAASGVTAIRVIARADVPAAIAWTNEFIVTVRPLSDQPWIEPIPNQVIYEGIPELRIPIVDHPPAGNQTSLRIQSEDRQFGSWVLEQSSVGTFLVLRPAPNMEVSPIRSSFTVSTTGAGRSNAVSFFVTRCQREFSPADRSPESTRLRWNSFAESLGAPFHAFAWADVNRDGFPDLTSRDRSAVLTNPKYNSVPGESPIGRSSAAGLDTAIWADVNGDNAPEVFAAAKGHFAVYRKRNLAIAVQPFEPMTNSLPILRVTGAVWADVDGNGATDLVYSGVTNETRRIVIALNDGRGSLTVSENNLPAVSGPVVATDFDGDDRVDLLLTETPAGLAEARIYLNAGEGTYVPGPLVATGNPITAAGTTDINGDGIPDVWLVQATDKLGRKLELTGFVRTPEGFTQVLYLDSREFVGAAEPAWGDFDHDGLPDFVAPYADRVLLHNGKEAATNYFTVYHNRGAERFETGGYVFPLPPNATRNPVTFVPAAADIDLDGDLDIVGFETLFKPFMNRRLEPNLPPGAPTGLRATLVGTDLRLSWSAASDPNQTAPLTYNLRVGSTPGTNDLVSSMSLPTGVRMLPAPGNVGFSRTHTLHLSRLDLDAVYWSVQAVDASFSGGTFAPEQLLPIALPGNQPPEIVAPAEVPLQEDDRSKFLVTVTDDRTPASEIRVRVTIDRPDLFNEASLNGSGNEPPLPLGREHRILLNPAPDANGTAILTVTATDRNGATSSREVRVVVSPREDPPLIYVEIPGFQLPGSPFLGTLTLVDPDTPSEQLSVTVKSSNPSLFPESGIQVTGTGYVRSVSVTPTAGALGVSTLTFTVTDGTGFTASAAASLGVQSQLLVPDPLPTELARLWLGRWVDADGDGRLDIVAAAETPSDFAIEVWRQFPAGTFSRVHRIPTAFRPTQLLVEDIDGDGDADLIAGGWRSIPPTDGTTLALLFNDGGSFGRSLPLYGEETLLGLVALDADGDGDLDLVGARNAYELLLWRHPASDLTGGNAAWVPLPLVFPNALNQGLIDVSTFTGLTAADVNEDGRMDLILTRTGAPASATGKLLIQGNDHRFTVKAPEWPPLASVLDWTDFDNDDRPDALVSFEAIVGIQFRVISRSAGAITVPLAFSSPGVGDLNGDGFEDVLADTTDGRGFGLLSEIAAESSRLTLQLPEARPLQGAAPGDVDGDGQPEVLLVGSRGLTLLRNQGSIPNLAPGVPSNLEQRQVAPGTLEFSWTGSTDPEQTGGLTYMIRIGTTPGGNEVVSGLALPDGRPLAPRRGNAGWQLQYRLDQVQTGTTYYWSVQAVDSGLARSAFAAEKAITVTSIPELGPLGNLSLNISAAAQEVTLTVSDVETHAEALVVSVLSSNPVLFPASRLQVSGSGAQRLLRLDPKPDRAGTAEITVRVTDSDQNVAERTFTVFVGSPNGFAVVSHQAFDVPQNGETKLPLNTFDPDGDFLTYQIVRQPTHGTLTGTPPEVVYHANQGYEGDDELEFLATTPGSWQARVLVALKVMPAHRIHPTARMVSTGKPATLRLVIRGRSNETVRVEHSRDLRTWESLEGDHRIPQSESLVLSPPEWNDDSPHFLRVLR